MYNIAQLSGCDWEKYLARVYQNDSKAVISTESIIWKDMTVEREGGEVIVSVVGGISIVNITKRLEQLIDCSEKVEGGEYLLKYNDTIGNILKKSKVKNHKELTQTLCDRINKIDPITNEVIGVMKSKRKSILKGHAKIRIAPEENLVQIVIRNDSPQGLKSLWKSIQSRVRVIH